MAVDSGKSSATPIIVNETEKQDKVVKGNRLIDQNLYLNYKRRNYFKDELEKAYNTMACDHFLRLNFNSCPKISLGNEQTKRTRIDTTLSVESKNISLSINSYISYPACTIIGLLPNVCCDFSTDCINVQMLL